MLNIFVYGILGCSTCDRVACGEENDPIIFPPVRKPPCGLWKPRNGKFCERNKCCRTYQQPCSYHVCFFINLSFRGQKVWS